MEELYFVERKKGNVIVSIMINRADNRFHFVNLTSGHICACAFNSVGEALQDMEFLMKKGNIQNFHKIIANTGEKS